MKYNDKFEDEKCIDSSYDPDEDRESGYFSRAYLQGYIEWLESKIKE